MWIFILESFCALALLLLIVWWTLPGKKKSLGEEAHKPGDKNEGGQGGEKNP